MRWPSPKIKDTRGAGRRQVALAVAKDRDNTESKTEKLCVPLVSPSSVLPGVNELRGPSPGCAGGRQRLKIRVERTVARLRWTSPKTETTRSQKTQSCALYWSRPVSYYLELTNCAGRRQVALSYPTPPRTRCVKSSRLVLFVVYTLPVPVHSLPVSGAMIITINVNQLQQDQNFVLKRLICRSGSPRRQRRRPLQAVHESDEWEGTVIQIVYFQVFKSLHKGWVDGVS